MRVALDFARIVADQQRLEDGADEMCGGRRILAAPSRRARSFAQAAESLIGFDADDVKRRHCMRAALGANREVLVNRHADRRCFDGSNHHVSRSSTKKRTSVTIASKKRLPFSAVARSGCPT